MPIRDQDARRKSLRNDYGADAAADAPSSHELALFTADPMVEEADGGGVEITGPGYGRVTVDQSDWTDDGLETLSAVVTFPAPTDEWDVATHWALLGDDGLWWDCNELAEPLVVTGAGDGPIVQIDLYYGDAVTTDEEP